MNAVILSDYTANLLGEGNSREGERREGGMGGRGEREREEGWMDGHLGHPHGCTPAIFRPRQHHVGNSRQLIG